MSFMYYSSALHPKLPTVFQPPILPAAQRVSLIVKGYVRSHTSEPVSESELVIPSEVIQLCITFCQSLDDIRYDVYCLSYCSTDQAKRLLFPSYTARSVGKSRNRWFSSNTNFPFLSGLHIWSVKCMSAANNSDDNGYGNHRSIPSVSAAVSGTVGICTNIRALKTNARPLPHANTLGTCYFLNQNLTLWNDTNDLLQFDVGSKKIANETWVDNDIITIELNCDERTLDFSLNGQRIFGKSIELAPFLTFYPCVYFRGYDERYQAVII